MKVTRQFSLSLLAIALTTAVFLAAKFAVSFLHLPRGSFVPLPSVMQAIFLLLSLAAMLLISKGRLAAFGFTRGTYKFSPRILLWILPMAVLSTAGALASRGGHEAAGPAAGFTKLQIIVFVWIFSSFCEEILVRGLLQTLLSRTANAGAAIRHWLSMPVLVSGLFFGAMHLALIPQMGRAVAPVILMATFLGLVAAHYREKTGSLLPAFIVHALFNIGGTLPMWAILWLRGGL
jgi:membrane protease YdiL (CAAX protease family)